MKVINDSMTGVSFPWSGGRRAVLRSVVQATMLALALGSQPLPAATLFSGSFSGSYSISGVPDFDQKREKSRGIKGLPGNGANYCVPTSAMNWLAWLASNRNPDFVTFAPPSDWESESYEEVTLEIDRLGDLMNTDKDNGTLPEDAQAGLRQWFEDRGIREYTARYFTGFTSPEDLGELTLLGGKVSMRQGYYEKDATTDEYYRGGGHLMTMTSLDISEPVLDDMDPVNVVGVNDPLSDEDKGDLLSQSVFSTDSYDLVRSTEVTDPYCTTKACDLLYRVEGYDGNAHLDGYMVIRPFRILIGEGPYHVPYEYPSARYSTSLTVAAARDPSLGGITVDVPEGVVDAVLSPSNTMVVYLAASSATRPSYLGAANLVDDRHLRLSGAPGALGLTTGRFDEAFVLYRNGRRVMKAGLSWNSQVTSVGLPYEFQSIAYDHVNDRVVALSVTQRSIAVLDRTLSLTGVYAVPGTIALDGDSDLGISPVTGNIFISSPSAARIVELKPDAENGTLARRSVIRDQELAAATGIAVDDHDHVFVSTAGGAGLEFEQGPLDGWKRSQNDAGNLWMTRLYDVGISSSNLEREQTANERDGGAGGPRKLPGR